MAHVPLVALQVIKLIYKSITLSRSYSSDYWCIRNSIFVYLHSTCAFLNVTWAMCCQTLQLADMCAYIYYNVSPSKLTLTTRHMLLLHRYHYFHIHTVSTHWLHIPVWLCFANTQFNRLKYTVLCVRKYMYSMYNLYQVIIYPTRHTSP